MAGTAAPAAQLQPIIGFARNRKARGMPAAPDPTPTGPNGRSALLWDMAGTLIPYDPVTGRPGALPGCAEFLPEPQVPPPP